MKENAPFRSPAEVFDWLGRFVNLEQGVMPPSMRPERMEIIARASGNPERCAPAVHIAGSKGKGSITAMAGAILEEAGFRVGRYMSPHVEDYRERITLGGRYFEDAIYISAGEKLREIEALLADRAGKEYKDLLEVSDGGAAEPTFFELLTLYFFLCAEEARCNALVVETGMGGRLDPTNISNSAVCIITCIELEHTDMLGDTIEKIALQKAGIIKQNTPVFIARQKHKDGADALRVFRQTAAQKNAPLFYLPEYAGISSVSVSRAGTAWNAAINGKNEMALHSPIPGEVQAENGTIAALAALFAFPQVKVEHARAGLERVTLPARFEVLRREPDIIVDGAHTPLSIELGLQTWTELYGKDAVPGILIFGCAMGKDVEAMARLLIGHFSHIIITRPGTYKISEPEKIHEVFTRIAKET
ncbi:MAG: tetrahydrofolate synthase, partial [Spirochaetaceae bacterium]|nr:tetrahydrofolate synthase [Spirochaetaceae bacterium]